MADNKEVKEVIQSIPSNIDPRIANRLALLQLQELEEKAKERAEKIEQEKSSRQAGIASMVKQREFELAKQSQCNHKKPFGESNLAGQRLHSNTYLYICQMCSKEFHDSEVPLDLRIDAGRVGGPSYISCSLEEMNSFINKFKIKSKFNEE